MTTKTTGAEFKRFYTDESVWTEGIYHGDDEMTLNGKRYGPGEFPYEDVQDDATVTLHAGFVANEKGDDLGSFEGEFIKWRKRQTTATFVVECDIGLTHLVKAAIKAVGGKVTA